MWLTLTLKGAFERLHRPSESRTSLNHRPPAKRETELGATKSREEKINNENTIGKDLESLAFSLKFLRRGVNG